MAKRIGIEDRAIRAGGWQTGFPIPLAGKTLGLLGAGHLGGAMVPIAKALGMDVVAWSQNLTEECCAALGVTRVTKDELVSSATSHDGGAFREQRVDAVNPRTGALEILPLFTARRRAEGRSPSASARRA